MRRLNLFFGFYLAIFSHFHLGIGQMSDPAPLTSEKELETNVPELTVEAKTNKPGELVYHPPEYNGFTLDDILKNAVIANGRSPIYNLKDGEQALCEIVDRSVPEGKNRISFKNECDKDLQKLGKDAHPDKIIGYVRAGFLLKHVRYRLQDSGAVALPKPLGGMRFGSVRCSDFSGLGSSSWRKWWNGGGGDQDLLSQIEDFAYPRLSVYALTDHTLLFDPFVGAEVILSNTEHSMQKAWLIVGQRINRLPLAVVETRDGLFLGGIIEKNASGQSAITWEQAVADKSQPFYLKVKQSKPLQKGNPVFTLFDDGTPLQKRVTSSNPSDFLIFPEAYADILKKGTWSLKTNFLIPKGDGFEPLQELTIQTSLLFEIEKKLTRMQLTFEAIEKENVRFLIASDYERREVERISGQNGTVVVKARPWKKQKEVFNTELKLGTDGAICFTDGELIYHLSAGKFSPKLEVYTVEKNSLYRP